MKKCSRDIIKRNNLFGKDLQIQKVTKWARKRKTSYAIFSDDKTVVAIGKELKGYLDSILWIAYDGETHGTGNYYLKSDDHGIICKWKED